MILFRADASQHFGFAPLLRCAFMASLLKKKQPVLICCPEEKAALKFLQESGLPFCTPAQWEKREEKKELRSIVFDLAEASEKDVQMLAWARKQKLRSVQLRAPGAAKLEADLVIDLALAENAPLHQQFRHFHQVRRKYRPRCKRLLVALGSGADYRLLRAAVDLLSRHGFRLKVASGFFQRKANKKILQRVYSHLHFVGKVQSLARAMFEADAALVTSGAMAAEAAACGTPALYFWRSPAQKTTAEFYASRGAGLAVGPLASLPNDAMLSALASLTLEKRQAMGSAGKELVDARGVFRVLDMLEKNGII